MIELSEFGPLSKYRVYDGATHARRVGLELTTNFVERVVIRRRHEGRIFWYVFSVDDELIRRLLSGHGVDLVTVLKMHEPDGDAVLEVASSGRGTPLGDGGGWPVMRGDSAPRDLGLPGRAVVLVDRDGNPLGVTEPAALPPTVATLFPRVNANAKNGVEPDQVVRFMVELGTTPTVGAGGLVTAEFAANEAEIELQAVASAADFLPVAGETWLGQFKVDRNLRTRPKSWEFQARVIGERPTYTMCISFVARGRTAGSASLTLGRKGAEVASTTSCVGSFSLPSPVASGVTLRITRSAGEWRILMLRDGIQAGDPASWPIDADADYLRAIENAVVYKSIQEAGYNLWTDLPAALTIFLEQTRGIATHIESDVPVAPFEALRLDPAGSGPLLGEDRVVTRWIPDAGVPRAGNIKVGRAACIRPVYAAGDALPSAEAEELWLGKQLPGLVCVSTLQDFEALLDRDDVTMVHFAGHADGVPPELVLADQQRIFPTRFAPDKPLLKHHPFLFLNGCRAAIGRHATPAAQGNMARTLLRGAQCAALIAPLVKVDSATALEAAKSFYSGVANGRSVGEAMQTMREQARSSRSSTHAGSYLSYLAYTSPELRLVIESPDIG